MHRTKHRFLSMLVAGAVALAVGASPALGSDGCSSKGCRAEKAPAEIVPAVPVTPASLQLSRTADRGYAAPASAPRGGVAAGEGGASPEGSSGVLFGIAGAVLVILAAGARLAIAARRSGS
jgi:hypothetical protein